MRLDSSFGVLMQLRGKGLGGNRKELRSESFQRRVRAGRYGPKDAMVETFVQHHVEPSSIDGGIARSSGSFVRDRPSV